MIHRALKLTRQFHRLTQADVASRLGISKSFLSELEAGKKAPTLELLNRYASEFDIPASTFLVFTEQLNRASPSSRRKRADKVLRFLEWAAGDEGRDDATA